MEGEGGGEWREKEWEGWRSGGMEVEECRNVGVEEWGVEDGEVKGGRVGDEGGAVEER